MVLVAAELWAADGTSEFIDDYVRDPKPLGRAEVQALLRLAYAAGYCDAHSGPPMPIIRACSFATALRLTLPLSS